MTPLKGKNEYLVLALVTETAVRAVVGSIVWAGSKKPKCREMSAGGYTLHSVCAQVSFFLSVWTLSADICHTHPSGDVRVRWDVALS